MTSHHRREPVVVGTGCGRIQEVGERGSIGGATALFAEIGVDDATVQHVLDRAGVSRRTFYQYFHGKEAVLAAVYDRWIDGLVAVIAEALQTPIEPVEKLVSALDAWIRPERSVSPGFPGFVPALSERP